MAKPNSGIEIKRRLKSFKDISLTFEPNPLTGDLTILKNERAISNAVKNIITFVVGEVPFNQDMGSYVTSYLFELYGPATSLLLEQEINRALKLNEPRVKVTDVLVEHQELQDQIWVQIEYTIIGYDEVFSVRTLLTPTR